MRSAADFGSHGRTAVRRPIATAALCAAAIALLSAVAPIGASAEAADPTIEAQTRGPGDATQFQIESDLTCQCGCGLTVHSCNHLNCSSGIPLKKEVADQLSAGKTRTEILEYFERKYGEKILAAPTTRGFNLAAWIVPFVAIGLGGAGIAFVLVRWRRASTTAMGGAGGAVAPAAPMDSARRARLDSALDEFERRS